MKRDSLRLFVGLFPGQEVIEALNEFVETAKRDLGIRGIRWVKPENQHLTLYFIGSVEAGRVSDLIEPIWRATSPLEPLSLQATGVGCFPSSRKPRILWAGIKGDLPALQMLQKRVASACASYIEKPDDKPFSPHLTLARMKHVDGPGIMKISRILELASARTFGEWQAGEVRLVCSKPGRDGSAYEVIESFRLDEVR